MRKLKKQTAVLIRWAVCFLLILTGIWGWSRSLLTLWPVLSLRGEIRAIENEVQYAESVLASTAATHDESVLEVEPTQHPTLNRLLSVLARHPDRLTLQVEEITAPASGQRGIGRARILMRGEANSVAEFLRGLERGSAHFLVTSVSIVPGQVQEEGGRWIVEGVLP